MKRLQKKGLPAGSVPFGKREKDSVPGAVTETRRKEGGEGKTS